MQMCLAMVVQAISPCFVVGVGRGGGGVDGELKHLLDKLSKDKVTPFKLQCS